MLWAAAQDPAPRVPVPPADEQKRIQTLLRKTYADFASKVPEEQAALLAELLTQAADPDLPPAQRYVYLTEARELAWKLGDVTSALAAADALGAAFSLDAAAVRIETLDETAKRARAPATLAAVGEAFLGMAESASAEERYDEALKLARKAEAPAKASKEADLAGRVKLRLDDYKAAKEESAKVAAMREKLKTAPADPEANLAVGLYLCLTRGDWEGGAPHLAKGSDAALAGPASKELAPPAKADERIALAEAWWQASSKREARQRDGLQGRAFFWYEQAREAAGALPKAEQAALVKKIDAFYEGLGGREGGVVRPGNVALARGGATVTSGAEALIDGISTGYTSGEGFLWGECPGSWTVTLAQPYQLRQIRLLIWDLDPVRYYQYAIDTSADGRVFTPLVDRTKGEWRSRQVISFAPRRVKAIRLRGTYGSAGNGFHVVEREAYCAPPAGK
jgi:hypothetical protein